MIFVGLLMFATSQAQMPRLDLTGFNEIPFRVTPRDAKDRVIVFGQPTEKTVMFKITSSADTTGTYVQFYNIDRLLNALRVCSSTMEEAESLGRKGRKVMIATIDTIFPRAGISWKANGEFISSFNNSLQPNIIVTRKGDVSLVLTGEATCRFKSSEMNNPKFSGDSELKTKYEISFADKDEVDSLITAIENKLNYRSPMIPMHPRFWVFDRKFNMYPLPDHMKRFGPEK